MNALCVSMAMTLVRNKPTKSMTVNIANIHFDENTTKSVTKIQKCVYMFVIIVTRVSCPLQTISSSIFFLSEHNNAYVIRCFPDFVHQCLLVKEPAGFTSCVSFLVNHNHHQLDIDLKSLISCNFTPNHYSTNQKILLSFKPYF